MKYSTLKNIVLITAMILLTNAYSLDTIKTLANVENVYVPLGFDSNDNSEIVVTGYLPNLCYRGLSAEVKKEGNTISVNLLSDFDPNNFACAESIISFVRTVELGTLEKGEYEIVINGVSSKPLTSRLIIEEAPTKYIDDYSYPLVTDVNVEANELIIKGFKDSDCLSPQEVQWKYNDENTWSVLPILKKTSSFCPKKLIPFEERINITDLPRNETTLFHVRSSGGQAVNYILNK